VGWCWRGLWHWGFANTRWGLLVRMVGDSADAARALGYSVSGVRIAATTAGGFIAGLGGASLTLFYPGSWNEGLSSGQGLIAVALVIFARWSPLRCLGAAAAVRRRRRHRPGAAVGGVIGWGYHLFNAVPYVLTLADPGDHLQARQPWAGSPGELSSTRERSRCACPDSAGSTNRKHGVVMGLVQLQLPVVETPAQLRRRRSASAMVARPGATRAPWTWWCSPSTRCTACR
jgi:hypothetical protein